MPRSAILQLSLLRRHRFSLSRTFLRPKENKKRMRFCVINTEDSDLWTSRTYSDMFIEGLRQDGDSWSVVNAAKGEPMDHILNQNYDGLVITGSHYNVRDQLPWYEPLCDIIRTAAIAGTPNIYGGCFGHQIVAHALGGTVDFNDKQRFVLKAETVCLLPSIQRFLRMSSTLPPALTLLQVHGDCVVSLPPDAELLASSPSCLHEMFIAGAYWNILGCQAHPEFDLQETMYQKLWPLRKHRLEPNEVEDAEASLKRYDEGQARQFMRAISSFLRQKPTVSIA
jgi:GMP synthase-like glutamine amidotransferase